MKIAFFELRKDEEEILNKLEKEYSVDVVKTEEILTQETLLMAKGCEGISILGHSKLERDLLDSIKEAGIKYISTRIIGYNHIDIEHAKKIGLKICNADYAPNGVADFTIMLILLTIRNYKPAMWRQNVNDYSLSGLMGREIRNLTIGVIGTGKIGGTVIKSLAGFQCKILANSEYESDEIKKYAQYVSMETLYKESDVISLHVPLTDESYHMINEETIDKMKDGVILINAARGELMDIQALIKGIEDQKIGALGLDVIENENGINHMDRKSDIIQNRDMAYLRQFPNVVLTQHMAFYTDSATESMVRCGVEGLVEFKKKGTYRCEIA